MRNRDDILLLIKEMMLEMFEIEQRLVTMDARLNEDLDLDSIDAVDMIVKLKELTGKSVKPEDFKNARTINDVVEALFNLTSE